MVLHDLNGCHIPSQYTTCPNIGASVVDVAPRSARRLARETQTHHARHYKGVVVLEDYCVKSLT